MPFKVGLTGNIGSGKSLAGRFFAKEGACVIEADDLVHTLLDAPPANLKAFAQTHFGKQVERYNGALDRNIIRASILKNPSQRQAWEALIHAKVIEQLQNLPPTENYYVLIIPLLLEKDLQYLTDRICVIRAKQPTLKERIKSRSQWSDDQIDAMLQLQMPSEKQIELADDVIENNHDEHALAKQVQQLHQLYIDIMQQEKQWA